MSVFYRIAKALLTPADCPDRWETLTRNGTGCEGTDLHDTGPAAADRAISALAGLRLLGEG
jgi:hypothetical protein